MAGTDDEHTSPGARENGTPLDRQAADKAHESVHEAQTAANPSSGTDGEPLHKRPGGTRMVRDRKGVRKVIEVPSTGHSWDGIRQ